MPRLTLFPAVHNALRGKFSYTYHPETSLGFFSFRKLVPASSPPRRSDANKISDARQRNVVVVAFAKPGTQ